MVLLKAKILWCVRIGLSRGKRLFGLQKLGFEYQDPVVWTESLYCGPSLSYKQWSWKDCRVTNKPFSSAHHSHCPFSQTRGKSHKLEERRRLGKEHKTTSNLYEFLRKGASKSMLLEWGPVRKIPDGFLGGPGGTRHACLPSQGVCGHKTQKASGSSPNSAWGQSSDGAKAERSPGRRGPEHGPFQEDSAPLSGAGKQPRVLSPPPPAKCSRELRGVLGWGRKRAQVGGEDEVIGDTIKESWFLIGGGRQRRWKSF